MSIHPREGKRRYKRAYKKLRRAAMWREQHGLCWWCRSETRLPPEGGWPGNRQPQDSATIEHLFCKLDPRRQAVIPGERRWVMACFKCNNERGRLIERACLSPAEIRARAKNGHHRKAER